MAQPPQGAQLTNMRLVIGHEQPDFDAIASVALAAVLFPGSVGALEGHVGGQEAEFLRLYRDQLPLIDADQVDLDAVGALIVVDTAERGRLGRFDALVDRVPVTVFDHHQDPVDPMPSSGGLHEAVGATVTLLVRRLAAEGAILPPLIASLGLLGLHEDTGGLAFDNVTVHDHLAAAYLLEQGASLELVRRFRNPGTPPALRAARDRMLAEAELVEVGGRRVAIGRLPGEDYAMGASSVAADLLAASAADAAVVLARMGHKTLVFGRAEAQVDIGRALRAVGGGGHARAAFARSDLDPDALKAALLAELPACVTPPLRALDLMSSPVLTVAESVRVAEARQLLAQRAHNGMPVLDEAGRVSGVISRRDLDHALRLGLGDAAVSGFMTRPAITAGPEATLEQLEDLVSRHDVGRLPVVDGDRLLGIVTRSDLVVARHSKPQEPEVAERIWSALPASTRALVEAAAEEAAKLTTTSKADPGGSAHVADGPRLHLVGGTVRDGLLGVGFLDLDLMLEGAEAADLAAALQRRFGGELTLHGPFGTASLELPQGPTLDLATARSEAYQHPGALPEVRGGDLIADLSRRDFSLNAMALQVQPLPRRLIDPFGGQADLAERRLRVLHPLSFVEDPTRMVRGARLAGRLGLSFDPDTMAKARAALRPEVVGQVSPQRLRAELELSLQEARVAPFLRHLDGMGALDALYGLANADEVVARLDAGREDLDPLPYLYALLASNTAERSEAAVQRFHWPQRSLGQLQKLRAAIADQQPPSEDALAALDPPARRALMALAPHQESAVLAFEHAPAEPRVRGRDVVSLGIEPGPEVGRLLARLAAARTHGEVHGFADELELARRWVAEARGAAHPPTSDRDDP